MTTRNTETTEQTMTSETFNTVTELHETILNGGWVARRSALRKLRELAKAEGHPALDRLVKADAVLVASREAEARSCLAGYYAEGPGSAEVIASNLKNGRVIEV